MAPCGIGGTQMSRLHKRLEDVELIRAYRDFTLAKGQFKGRTRDELKFFSIHGYFPDAPDAGVPTRHEFTVGGIRTVITTERVDH